MESQNIGGLEVVLLLLYIPFIIFVIYAYVRIIQKAGYSGWWVLMAIVPIGNLIMLGLFAFKEWPAQRELAYLRGYAAYTGLRGYGPPRSGPDAPSSPPPS